MSVDTGRRLNAERVMITASQSFAATRATNCRRRSPARSSPEAARTRACGRICNHSRLNCSSMWFGTTTAGLLTSPSRFSSLAAIAIVAVFPAPTSWNRPTAGSATIRATAAR